MHLIVSFYGDDFYLWLIDNGWETCTYFSLCLNLYSRWVEFYKLNCQYYRWPVCSWRSQFKRILRMDVGNFERTLFVYGSRMLIVKIFSFFAFGSVCRIWPFRRIPAVWLTHWQFEQGGYTLANLLQVVCFPSRRSRSLRLRFQHSLNKWSGFLHYRHIIRNCSEFCGLLYLKNVFVAVAIVGIGLSPSVSNPLFSRSRSSHATSGPYVPFSK